MAGGGSDGSADVAREAERLAGDLLDGRVPTADAPAASPGTVGAASDAATQRVVDGIVGVVLATPPRPPHGDPGTGPTGGGPTGDGLRTVAAMTTDAPAALAEPLEAGASFAARHGRNLAVAGMAVVALAAFLGALLAIGGGAAGGAAGPAATVTSSPARSAPASGLAAGVGSAAPSPSLQSAPLSASGGPEASASAAASPAPSAAAATATPAASTSAPGSSVTLRGTLNVKPLERTGLRIGAHDVELVLFPDVGTVTGSFTIEIPSFPIGALLTHTFGGDDDPAYAAFKRCTVQLVMEGTVSGTVKPATGALKGKVVFRPVSHDVHGCLATRPPNVTIDTVTKASTVRWSGTLKAGAATGTLALDPVLRWTAREE